MTDGWVVVVVVGGCVCAGVVGVATVRWNGMKNPTGDRGGGGGGGWGRAK